MHTNSYAAGARTDSDSKLVELSYQLGPIALGAMTVISCYVLLLLIALATIAMATQPVKGEASEGQSNPGGCISDWRGLKKAYLDRQSSADVENSIFDFSSTDAIRYGVLVMFYDVGPPPNTSTSGRRGCCQRGSKDCHIQFIYRFRIFKDIHPPLFYARMFHKFHPTKKYTFIHYFPVYTVSKLCWSLPLCNNSWLWNEKQLWDFSNQVYFLYAPVGHLVQDVLVAITLYVQY